MNIAIAVQWFEHKDWRCEVVGSSPGTTQNDRCKFAAPYPGDKVDLEG